MRRVNKEVKLVMTSRIPPSIVLTSSSTLGQKSNEEKTGGRKTRNQNTNRALDKRETEGKAGGNRKERMPTCTSPCSRGDQKKNIREREVIKRPDGNDVRKWDPTRKRNRSSFGGPKRSQGVGNSKSGRQHRKSRVKRFTH